ncbi:LPS export ABC transporter periplasmic protein LptC [Lentibacter algarum]|uniref:LPS export ABC transporter periplasmic protein LptC n=1 Tax=Lentibacter algarum TaxID=576131 RepID=UPI001C06DCC3|nr:LPS export ABC transporter periplasmic protein LptC [Lentibacter algarum]MBU2981045.1 LPS export ABC transporter periplasmic protein LptC [Lentibacter algarum]
MQSTIDRHTRIVAWAKIILPIIALGLLSTLFLLSKSTDPISSIPFSEADIEERTRNQQISSPEVFGVTSRGDLVSLNAAFAKQSDENSDITIAEQVKTSIKLVSGADVNMQAGVAQYDAKGGRIRLSSAVFATTTSGFSFEASGLDINMLNLSVISDGPVTGRGPASSLTAGQMTIEVPEGEKDAHLLFSNGVKLIYTPHKPED